MNRRPFGALGSVSAVSLGGGGIGRVYGDVDADEAALTIRAAIAAGVDLLDLAPIYGPGEASPEAETLVGRTFNGRLPDHVRVTSKVVIEDPCSGDEVRSKIRTSLTHSLKRLGRNHLDLYILHSYIRPSDTAPLPGTVDIDTVRRVVRPMFLRLIDEGMIAGWGLTATAATDPVCELLDEDPAPTAIQCVTNALDAIGNLWPTGLEGRPDNARIRESAVARGIGVMGIRALAAGAMAEALDRALPASDPAARDAARAGGFRAFAKRCGISPSYLAYQYALSLPGVATVVSGAKTRGELEECLAAEAAPRLTKSELEEIEAACAWSDVVLS
jgi:aryl-alcohol dehydrogenase-like predicted oxidoreductase